MNERRPMRHCLHASAMQIANSSSFLRSINASRCLWNVEFLQDVLVQGEVFWLDLLVCTKSNDFRDIQEQRDVFLLHLAIFVNRINIDTSALLKCCLPVSLRKVINKASVLTKRTAGTFNCILPSDGLPLDLLHSCNDEHISVYPVSHYWSLSVPWPSGLSMVGKYQSMFIKNFILIANWLC